MKIIINNSSTRTNYLAYIGDLLRLAQLNSYQRQLFFSSLYFLHKKSPSSFRIIHISARCCARLSFVIVHSLLLVKFHHQPPKLISLLRPIPPPSSDKPKSEWDEKLFSLSFACSSFSLRMLIHPLFLCHTIATPTVVQHQQRRIIKFLKSISLPSTQNPRTEKKRRQWSEMLLSTKRQNDNTMAEEVEEVKWRRAKARREGKKVVKTFRSLLHFFVVGTLVV